jgi:glycosyltransferase involved in cell wall biosynthesis
MPPLKTPLVSIVIPTFNRISYLEIAIESIFKQSYKNIQLIVVDDASTDNTTNLLLVKYGSRLKLIKNNINLGQVKSLNKAWPKCKGKYVGYLSSDDYLHYTAIAKLVKILESDDHVVCAYPDNYLVDATGKIIKNNVCSKFSFKSSFLSLECPIGVGALFRKSLLQKTNGWNEKNQIMPDLDFWLTINQYGKFCFVNEVHGAYRFHKGSGIYNKRSIFELNQVLEMIKMHFTKNKLAKKFFDREVEIYATAYIFMARHCLRSFDFKTAIIFSKKALKINLKGSTIISIIKNFRYAYSPLIRMLFRI